MTWRAGGKKGPRHLALAAYLARRPWDTSARHARAPQACLDCFIAGTLPWRRCAQTRAENVPPRRCSAAPPSGPLADLVRADVARGDVPPRLNLASLRGCGLSEAQLRCCVCGADSATEQHFIALARTAPLSTRPLPHGAVRLSCVDCLIRDAERCGVEPNAGAVDKFTDKRIMGAMEACWLLQGFETMSFGGVLGEG